MQDADREETTLAVDAWRSPLEDLENTLIEVARSIGALRDALEHGEAGEKISEELHVVSVEEAEIAEPAVEAEIEVSNEKEQPKAVADSVENDAEPASFQEVWERLRRERDEPSAEDTGMTPENAVDVEEAAVGDGVEIGPAAVDDGRPRSANFENVWQRLQHEREERSAAPIDEIADVRGLGNLPQAYRMTIEDRDGTPVDLVPVHRALLNFAAADDVSLNNFANGTAVISLRTNGELDLDELGAAISAATSRECEVISQGQGKLFLRLSIEDEAEQDGDD